MTNNNPTLRIISRHEIRSALSFETLIPALAQGFRDYHSGKAVVAPITNIDVSDYNGEMHIKPGYMIGSDWLCVKIATCYYDNPSVGLPTRDGLVVLSNLRNGRIEALLCDAGLITDMRTAGSSAVAIEALAPDRRVRLGLVGAGTQAYWHAAAVPLVRTITDVRVWSRRPEASSALATRIGAELDMRAEATSLEAVADCDVIVTATPAREPVLDGQKLRPGALVVAMGADALGKKELGASLMSQASLVVTDSRRQCEAVGELQWYAGETPGFRIEELGAILCGAAKGRQRADECIIFDSTGVAFQDSIGAIEVVSRLQVEVEDGRC